MCNLVRDVISYFCDAFGDLEECNLFELKVVLNELILNAIKHGNKGDINKSVKVTAGISNGGFAYFIIEDEGDGYNYKSLLENDYNRQEELDCIGMRETGRGILIVKNLCENIKYSQKGNKVIILKKLCKA